MAGAKKMFERSRWRVASALLCFCVGACGRPEMPAESASPIELRALDGTVHRPMPLPADEPTLLIFTASDCPVANGYAPEICALHSDFVKRGVRFYLVNVETGTPLETLSKHAEEYGLPGPILMDPRHALARRVGAEMTPEAVVVRPGGAVAYRGRIDDRYPDLGVRRALPSTFELRDALESVLAGRAVAVPRTTAVGCFIGDWAE